jgi:outer membrane protein TolC
MKSRMCQGIVTAVCWLIALTAVGVGQTNSTVTAMPAEKTERSAIYIQSIDPVNGRTAQELVGYAISHNGELAAARAMLNEVRGRLRQAPLKPNPTLESSGTKLRQQLHGRPRAPSGDWWKVKSASGSGRPRARAS